MVVVGWQCRNGCSENGACNAVLVNHFSGVCCMWGCVLTRAYTLYFNTIARRSTPTLDNKAPVYMIDGAGGNREGWVKYNVLYTHCPSL